MIESDGTTTPITTASTAGAGTAGCDALEACDMTSPRWSAWAAGYGGGRNTAGDSAMGSSNVATSLWGTAVGDDYALTPETLLGFAVGGGGTAFNLSNLGNGHSDLVQAGVYVRHTRGPAYVTATLVDDWQSITTDRTVTVAHADHLHANFDANALSGRVEGGWHIGSVTPYAAGQVSSLFLPGYVEQVQGGARTFALAYSGQTVTDWRSELGLRAATSFAAGKGVLTLGGRLAWAHNFNPTPVAAAAFQTLPGTSFAVTGASIGSDAALTSVSAEMKWNSGWSLAGGFDGSFSGTSQSYGGKVMLKYRW
jgi:uncharacterized protein with beta-barrel porin domain